MRENRSDAGANVVTADHSRVTDEYSVDVCDRVEWTGWKNADRYSGFTSAWSVLSLGHKFQRWSHKKAQEAHNNFFKSFVLFVPFGGLHTYAAFGSTGKFASCQASHPPIRARALDHPACRSSCATRALVASFGQAQYAMSHASFGRSNFRAFITALSG